MAASKTANLKPDEGIAKISPHLFEKGYSGLRFTGTDTKTLQEESNKKFAGRELYRTVDSMMTDPFISASVGLYITMLSRLPWKVVEPTGATQQEKDRTKFITECMSDMKRGYDWSSFIVDVSFYPIYGFGVNEKVFRQRLRKNGSRHNDGLIGWSHFPSRKQSTIDGWVLSDDGRDLLGVVQSTENLQKNPFTTVTKPNKIIIPRDEFMLFTNESRYGSPQGKSFLKASYIPWRYKTLIQDSELEGLLRDLRGIPVGKLPAQFLNPDADAQTKAVADNFATQLKNLHSGEQACIILPSEFDENSRLPLFSVELLQGGGSKGYSTNEIVGRYNTELLVSLFTDFLALGSSGTGSFALANSKTELIAMSIQTKAKEIARVINNDLIPHTYALNGWDDARMPEIQFDDFGDTDLDVLGSFLQRTVSIGAVEVSRDLLNLTARSLGLPEQAADVEPRKEYLPEKAPSTKAGKEVGSPFDGGSKSAGGGDKSVSNKSNAA